MADDLISRSALLAKRFRIFSQFLGVMSVVAVKDVEHAPAVDAVEVVRCGTPCRWLYNEPDDYCCMNHKGLVRITPDSFCSYGRTVEENAAD